MKTTAAFKFEGEVTDDGQLHVELPSGLLRGPVLVTLEPMAKDALILTEEDLKGEGLTAAEISSSPEIGAWAEDRAISSGAEYVEHLRAASSSYSW